MKRENLVAAFALLILTADVAFSQTEWKKYAGSPVLVPTESWEASYGVIGARVLKIGNEYKMWYTGLSFRRQIGLATSEDGIHWKKSSANPVLHPGQPGNFDSEHVNYGAVLLYNNQYWMWYSGYNGKTWQIGLATSPDGIQWTKYAGNPVITVNEAEWDASGITDFSIIFHNQSFKMWYNAVGSRYGQAVGYAESSDGIHWQKHQNNPIFTTTSNWESAAVAINSVIFFDGLYHAWYGGNNRSFTSYGYAVSIDGIHWEKYSGNPIFVPGIQGAWDSATLGGFNVLREGNVYKMWYSGRSGEIWNIGYATSTAPTPVERLVSLPRVYGLPKDTIKVALSVNPVGGIYGGDVVIKFDPQVLSVTKVETTNLTKEFLVVANLDTPGVARISLASAVAPVGPGGDLVTIKMVVNPALTIPDTTFSRQLYLAMVSLYNQHGQPLAVTKRDGQFVLGTSHGDVNRDGIVNAADAILTLRIAAGLVQPTPDQISDADVDRNGKVESIDASCILRRAVGLDCLPGGTSQVAANLVFAPFSANNGNQVETNISVVGIDNLISGDVSLRFDPTALEIIEIRPGPEVSGISMVTNLTGNGRANFSFAASRGFVAKNLAVIRVQAKTPISEKHLRSTAATLFDNQGRRWNGIVTAVDERSASALPAEFRLEQNYPNPFYLPSAVVTAVTDLGLSNVSATQIRYALPRSGRVKLAVYDLNGRLVRLLEDVEKSAGEYLQLWDGMDAQRTPVAAGVYIYRLQAGQTVLSRKLLFLP